MLYLFPNLLDESQNHREYLPASVEQVVADIEGLIVESEKSGRAFLKRFSFSQGRSFREIPMQLLSEHTTAQELKDLIKPLVKGETWGLISDCGLPCLADPGAALVALAHEQRIPVKTFSGPSSIVMALMLSGLNTQKFTFHGYLPREAAPLEAQLKKMGEEIARTQYTQVFIEAPYRNQKLLESLVQTLPPSLFLCVACDLTLTTEEVCTHSIKQWKGKDLSRYQKRATVFLLGHQALLNAFQK